MIKKFLKTKKEKYKNYKKYQLNENREALEMCRKCFSFRYDNGWHFERPEYLLDQSPNEKVAVEFSLCSACIEESLAFYDMEYA